MDQGRIHDVKATAKRIERLLAATHKDVKDL
jgi:hypothetical protein